MYPPRAHKAHGTLPARRVHSMLTGGGHPTIAPFGSAGNVNLGVTPAGVGGRVVATSAGHVVPVFQAVAGAAPASLVAPWAHTTQPPPVPVGTPGRVVATDVFGAHGTQLFAYATPAPGGGGDPTAAVLAGVPVPVNPLTQWTRPEDVARAYALGRSAAIAGVEPAPPTVMAVLADHAGDVGTAPAAQLTTVLSVEEAAVASQGLFVAGAALARATARAAAASSAHIQAQLHRVSTGLHPESVDCALWASTAAHAASMLHRLASDAAALQAGRDPYAKPADRHGGAHTTDPAPAVLPPSQTDISMLVDRIVAAGEALRVARSKMGEAHPGGMPRDDAERHARGKERPKKAPGNTAARRTTPSGSPRGWPSPPTRWLPTSTPCTASFCGGPPASSRRSPAPPSAST